MVENKATAAPPCLRRRARRLARKLDAGPALQQHGTATSDSPNFFEALNRIRNDLARCRTRCTRALRKQMAAAYAVAQLLCQSKGYWTRFCNQKWAHGGEPPQLRDQADALRFVLRFIHGSGDVASKRASMYYRALSVLRDEGIPPDKVAEEIKARGGFKKLAAEHARSASKADSQKENRAEAQADDDDSPEAEPKATDGWVKKAAVNQPDRRNAQPAASNIIANFRAELEPGVEFFKMPAGTRFSMRATLKEVGKANVILVHQIERIDR